MASHISRMIPLLVITLICIAAVEGGYSVLEYFLFRRPVVDTTAPGAPAREEKEGQIPSGAGRDHSIILTRNLFGPHFNTADASPAQAVDVAADLDKSELEIVLVGTIGGSEGENRAIILDKKTRKQDLYKEGDEVKGASVKEILRGKVILDVEGKEELLDMSEAATVRPVVKAQQGSPQRLQPQAGVQAGPVAQPESGMEAPVPATETAPPAQEAPGALEEAEPPAEIAPEAAVPEDVEPEAAPAPEVPAEAAPPAEEPQPAERKIVRPRVIRPYRPS